MKIKSKIVYHFMGTILLQSCKKHVSLVCQTCLFLSFGAVYFQVSSINVQVNVKQESNVLTPKTHELIHSSYKQYAHLHTSCSDFNVTLPLAYLIFVLTKILAATMHFTELHIDYILCTSPADFSETCNKVYRIVPSCLLTNNSVSWILLWL